MSKVCSKCKKEKTEDNFVFNNGKFVSRCKTCDAEYNKEYREKNKERLKQQRKDKYWRNREENIEKAIGWYKNNKEHKREYDKQYRHNKYNNDEIYNLITRLRARLRAAFIRYSENGKNGFSKDYGISWEDIIEYLGPCPGDRKEYHIDHILPLSAFDFNDLEQIKLAFAPENHQWLKTEDNLSKGDKYDIIELSNYLKGENENDK